MTRAPYHLPPLPSMLNIATLLQARVLPQGRDVPFRCGNILRLRPVQGHAFLRALRSGPTWLVFDLRPLLPEVADDFTRLPPADHAAVVRYSLRALFPTAVACLHAIKRHPHHRIQAQDEPLPEAA